MEFRYPSLWIGIVGYCLVFHIQCFKKFYKRCTLIWYLTMLDICIFTGIFVETCIVKASCKALEDVWKFFDPRCNKILLNRKKSKRKEWHSMSIFVFLPSSHFFCLIFLSCSLKWCSSYSCVYAQCVSKMSFTRKCCKSLLFSALQCGSFVFQTDVICQTLGAVQFTDPSLSGCYRGRFRPSFLHGSPASHDESWSNAASCSDDATHGSFSWSWWAHYNVLLTEFFSTEW